MVFDQLPNLIILGASRAGTTFIYDKLKRDPRVYVPSIRKEINFFSAEYQSGLDHYKRNYLSLSSCSENEIVVQIDASPSYLGNANCAQRIADTYAQQPVKFIICVRDPVLRAHSQWKYRIQKRGETRSFETFLYEEQEPRHLSSYGKNFEQYLSYFKIEQFLFIDFDDIKNNEDKVINSIYDFIEIGAPACVADLRMNKNAAFVPRFPRTYQFLFKVKQMMRKNRMDWLVNYLKKHVFVEAVFRTNQGFQSIAPATKAKMDLLFEDDQKLFNRLRKQ
jgi:hypothetical protein